MNLKSTSAVGTTHDQSINKREKVVENPEKAASASQSHLEMSMKYERTMVCCNTQIKRSEYMEITDSRCRLNQPYFPPKTLKYSETFRDFMFILPSHGLAGPFLICSHSRKFPGFKKSVNNPDRTQNLIELLVTFWVNSGTSTLLLKSWALSVV